MNRKVDTVVTLHADKVRSARTVAKQAEKMRAAQPRPHFMSQTQARWLVSK